MKKAWFSLAELAAEVLPGVPHTRQNIAALAQREEWADGEKARERVGRRGGGYEYHFSLLPAPARAVLVARYGAVAAPKVQKRTEVTAPVQLGRGEAAWGSFEGLPETLKGRARTRLEALQEIDALTRRMGRAAAIRVVATKLDVTAATIHNWCDLVRGVARADWLPALAPAPRGGGGRPMEVDERFWEAFRADYLRLAQPSLRSVYRRTCDIAAEQGWAVPSEKKIERLVKALPPEVVVLGRKGAEAAKRMFPAQERDRSVFHALQAVNGDGHKWDVFCRWPDGTVARPLMVAFQDLYSGMFLAWRIAKSENQDLVRLCFGDLIETFGIPDLCWLDNGRAFAGKMNTGGIKNRYRFKVKAEEPDGVFKQLGVEVRWTTPYAGQSKPIERGFGDFARDIAKHPAFQGAYCGNSPTAKPEDYGSRAVPIDEFIRIVNEEIAKHNSRPGRTSKVCAGRSLQETFEESYRQSAIRMATAEQRRLCMLAIQNVKPRRENGSIILLGNRYWHEKLLAHRGRLLTVRFDPDDVQQDLAVHAADGTLICVAELVEAVGFDSTTAAREHAAARNAYMRATRERLAAERKMTLHELAALAPKGAPYTPPDATVIRPLFTAARGNLAVKPAPEREEEDDAFDQKIRRGLRLVTKQREG